MRLNPYLHDCCNVKLLQFYCKCDFLFLQPSFEPWAAFSYSDEELFGLVVENMEITSLAQDVVQIKSQGNTIVLLGDQAQASKVDGKILSSGNYAVSSYGVERGDWQSKTKQIFWGAGEYEQGEMYTRADEVKMEKEGIQTIFTVRAEGVTVSVWFGLDKKVVNDFFNEDELSEVLLLQLPDELKPAKDQIQEVISQTEAKLILPVFVEGQKDAQLEELQKWYPQFGSEEVKKWDVNQNKIPAGGKFLVKVEGGS